MSGCAPDASAFLQCSHSPVSVQKRPESKTCLVVLQVSICGIHRDEKIWGNPNEYVPERWIEGSPQEATDAQKKAWMPFGDGIRSCVGEAQPLLVSSHFLCWRHPVQCNQRRRFHDVSQAGQLQACPFSQAECVLCYCQSQKALSAWECMQARGLLGRRLSLR